ncbi:MAG TPA: carboxypeptidase regulatory-like domain-containing protein [Pyrinomonadaceae bacterium]|nr:carboxypeptidase regulatory-like domain-containing protein [Pyrinomonadaceae bacterium]
MRKLTRLSLSLSLLLVSIPASGQSNYAGLGGTVFDPQQRAIPGAAVELKSAGTQSVRAVTSDEQGVFQIPGLLPGDYELTVRADGFAPSVQTLRLEVGQELTLDVSLGLAGVKDEQVEVQAVEVLRTTKADIGEVIESAAIRNLPLNGRMLIDLVLTVPGAHASHGAQTGDMNPLYWRPGQRSAISIGGNRPNANYFLLDGATNTDPTFNTLNFSPSPDAVQEFKVQTGSYSADMGGAGGGQVNIVTKSGTNEFHGTVYEFLRNDALDARTFNEMGDSTFLVQNNFGGAIGGPIVRNRTFFFFNYEGLRRTKADTMIATVPTAEEISGDFSMSGADIYNPFSARPNPNFDPSRPVSPSNPQVIRDQFQGNVIPQNLINPAALLFLQKYVPRPNMEMGMNGCGMTMMGAPTVVGAGMDCNNYLDVRNERHVTDQATIRVDQVFERGDSISARYSFSSERGFMPQNLPGFGALHDNLAQHGSVAWNHIISPRMVNIASITFSRLAMHRSSENSESNDIVSELGIQGVGFGGQGAYGAPWFNVQGFSGVGDSFAATPMHAWDTILEARDLLNWQVGRHSLKLGGSYRHYIWPMWGFFQNRGYYQFTSGFTTRTATSDGTGSALASFLLGLPAVKQRQAGIPQMQLRQWYADGFIHDTFQLARNTTIEIGLRYEYMSPLVDIRFTNSNLVFQDGRPFVFIGGQQGYPEGLMYSNKLNFAPRFGISQNVPRLGLVLHAAFGIFFTPVDMNTWCNQRHNVPYVFPETQQADNFTPPASLIASQFNFGQPVLGQTVVSFAAFDPHAPSQYIQQWSFSIEKSLGRETTLELGYLGSHGVHLQRAHLINNAPPGPGAIGPRRPYRVLSFLPGTVLPDNINATSLTFPVSGINLLENSAQSWYNAGYVNVRRRYSRGFTLLTNYTWAKNLSDAPDFRSPMFESAIPQDNSNLSLEKGPACDIRHRFALSAVYDLPALGFNRKLRALTKGWHLSAIFQAQSGFPFTISVFGDTANSGTLLGENPVRANYTGQPVFDQNSRTADRWFNPAAFAAPPAFTFGNVGRNTVYGPGLQTLDLALHREFALTENVKFQFRAELFNALNHTNLGTPNRFVNTPQFGTITEAATPGRQAQLSGRLSF